MAERPPTSNQSEAAGAGEDDEGRPVAAADGRLTARTIVDDPEVRTLIDRADAYLEAIGYTYHGITHVGRVATRARKILHELGIDSRDAELAEIAGYLHDIGNVVHRVNHPQTSAIMAFEILYRMGMSMEEITVVIGAIGNHDEVDGEPVSNVAAALIIADKSDVLRSRVRNPVMVSFDIHDRVNYAVTRTELKISKEKRQITLAMEVDTNISSVAEYFEIFLSRMHITRRAAAYLNCDFVLSINGVQLM